MAQLLEDSSFCEEFIQQCPAAVEVLNLVAQECSPGERAFRHLYIFDYILTLSIKNCLNDLFQGSVSAWLRLSVRG